MKRTAEAFVAGGLGHDVAGAEADDARFCMSAEHGFVVTRVVSIARGESVAAVDGAPPSHRTGDAPPT